MSDTANRFIIAQEGIDGADQERIADSKELLNNQLDTQLEYFRSHETPINPELEACIEDLKNAYLEYYTDLGIPEDAIKLPNHILRQDTRMVPGGHYGVSVGDIIAFGSCDSMEDIELRNFIEAKTVAHEMYHNTGQTKFRVLNDAAGEPISVQERSGIAYQSLNRRRLYPSALEEGRATEMEGFMTEMVLKKHFPNAYQRYQELQAIYKSAGYAQDPNEYKFITLDTDPGDTEKVKYKLRPSGYMQGYNLIQYLKKVEIEKSGDDRNLEVTLERGRLLGETLPFARFIRNNFGADTINQVFLASNENGNQIVEKLKQDRIL